MAYKMFILFFLSLHSIIASVYGIFIELGISRHSITEIPFLFIFPYVGAVCLFTTEFGVSKDKYKKESMFKFYFGEITLQNKNLDQLEIPEDITKEFLIKVIETRPDNYIKILKKSMDSTDIEVVHIATVIIMKIRTYYENKIKELALKRSNMPDDGFLIREEILLLKEYYCQDLIKGKAGEFLLEQQHELIIQLLKYQPNDVNAITDLIENYAQRGKINLAIKTAKDNYKNKFMSYRFFCTYIDILKKYNRYEQIPEVVKYASWSLSKWSYGEIKQWHKRYGDLKIEK